MHTTLPLDPPQILRINAAGVADAVMGVVSPGALLLEVHPNRVVLLAAGHPDTLARPGLPAPTRTLDRRDCLLIPPLVNAHAHLDLTHIGPVPHDPADGFVAWVDHIRANRRTDSAEIAAAVELGVRLSVAGGTVAVGDIAGAPAGRLTDTPARVLAASPLAGVSYLEFFGIGRSAPLAIDRLARFARDELGSLRQSLGNAPVRVGLQPHAPNTVDLAVYRWAAEISRRHDLPLSTHLAETPEEREFVARGTGPQRAMLERFGLWDDGVLQGVGQGRHPVAHLAPVLSDSHILCAHVNDATDTAIEVLARTRTPVAYCPRASAYFGAERHFGPHRYPDMLAAGVRVCLGTDSMVNLDTPDRISVLDEMRLLASRDGTDARTLLSMATVNGATALGLEPGRVSFGPGLIAGVLAIGVGSGVDPWESAMMGGNPPEVLLLSRESF